MADKFKFIHLFCCETEARQVSLFGGRSQAGVLIWNSALHTHEKQFGTNILPFYFFLLRLKFDNDVSLNWAAWHVWGMDLVCTVTIGGMGAR